MKRWKVYLCAAVFLLLTAVKMIAPAAAADAREVLLPAINADDDYKSVFAEIRSVFAPAPVQTQDEQLRQYLPAVNMSVWSTPAPEPTPTPTPEPTPEPTPTPTPEPTQSPQLQAALAAREAFLNEQAVYSGYAVPTNVSYAVSELPFAHTSPVAGYTSSGFGYRLHPLENKVKFHYGTDFAANSGTAVCAFADGTVLAAGQDDGYGNYVKIRHADGYTTLYGHCSKLLVRAGETVTAGDRARRRDRQGDRAAPALRADARRVLLQSGVLPRRRMKRRRFALDVRPGAVALLAGLYFLLPLRWCARLALAVAVHELGHVAALVLCGTEIYGLRMEACGLALRCAPPEDAVRTVAAALAGPAAGAGLFCILRGLGCPEGADLSLLYSCVNLLPVLPLDGGRALQAAVAALAGERAAELLLDVLGLVLPVALMGLGVVLFARGMGLALGAFGAWLALLQPGMTCQGGKHDVKYSYYHM